MSLPTVCPKTGSGPCIGNECKMYIIDWRSNEEYCIMGYYSASDRKKLGKQVVDNYAAKVKSSRKNSTKAAIFVNVGSKSDKLKDTEEADQQPGKTANNIKLKVKKTKHITDLSDIPDDYEEQFWEKL
jgi:hypothetical protein